MRIYTYFVKMYPLTNNELCRLMLSQVRASQTDKQTDRETDELTARCDQTYYDSRIHG